MRDSSGTISRSFPLRLEQAARRSDGGHTGTELSRLVMQGKRLRLRPGVYITPEQWLASPPWIRHQAATAATALESSRAVFCRETALILHGLPLLAAPDRVHVRAETQGSARRVPAQPLTGKLSRSGIERLLFRYTPASERDLEPLPVQRFEHARMDGRTRPQMREALARGEAVLPTVTVDAAVLPVAPGPATGYCVEPLEFTVIDTLSRTSPERAVVTLDAALRELNSACLDPKEALRNMERHLPSLAARRRWGTVLSFADARAESPGESLSRWRIAELGFLPPDLQAELHLDVGMARVDFIWEEAGVVGEFDGKVKYMDPELLQGGSTSQVVYQEKLREDAIRRSGRMMVRWGWDELRRPERLRGRLKQAGVPVRTSSPKIVVV